MSQSKKPLKEPSIAHVTYMFRETTLEWLNKSDSSHVINREFQIKGMSTSNIKHYLEPLSPENTKPSITLKPILWVNEVNRLGAKVKGRFDGWGTCDMTSIRALVLSLIIWRWQATHCYPHPVPVPLVPFNYWGNGTLWFFKLLPASMNIIYWKVESLSN